MAADSELVLKVSFDTADAHKATQSLVKTFSRFAKNVSDVFSPVDKAASAVEKYEARLKRANDEIQKAETEYQGLLDKMEQLQQFASASVSMRGVVPDDLKGKLADVVKELDAANERMVGLDDKAKRYAAALENAKAKLETTEANEIAAEMADAEQKTESAAGDMQTFANAAENASQSFTRMEAVISSLTAQVAALISELRNLHLPADTANETEQLSASLQESAGAMEELSDEVEDASREFGAFDAAASSGMRSVGNFARQAASATLQVARNVATAGRNLGSGLVRGISRGVTALRNLTKRTHESRSAFDGLGGGISKTFNRIKSLAAAALFFNIMRRALKSMSDYMMSLLNSNEQFAKSLGQVKSALQVAFTPIFEAILPALNALMAALARVMTAIASFVSMLFGKTLQQSVDATKSLQKSAKAIGGTGSAAKKAEKEIQKYLTSFDEIMTIGSKAVSDNESGGGGVTGTLFEELSTGVSEFMKRIMAAIEDENWFELGALIADEINAGVLKLHDYINKIGPEAVKWANRLAIILNGVVATLNWEMIGDTLADGLNWAIKTLGEFLLTFDWVALARGIGDGLNKFIKELDLDYVADTLSETLNNMVYAAIKFFEVTDWGALGTKIGSSLQKFLSNVDWVNVGKVIAAKITSLAELAHTFLEEIDWVELGKNIASSLNTFIEETDWQAVSQAIGGAIKGMLESAYNFVTNVDWKNLGTTLSGLLAEIFSDENLKLFADTVIAFVSGLNTALLSANESGSLTTTMNNFADAISRILTEAPWVELLGGTALVIIKALERALLQQVSTPGSMVNALFKKDQLEEDTKRLGEELALVLQGASRDEIEALASDFGAIGEAGGTQIASGVEDGTDELGASVRKLIGEGMLAPAEKELGFNSSKGKFGEYGDDIIEGLDRALAAGTSDVETATKGVTDAVKTTVENEMDMHSPSVVMEGYGKNSIRGLIDGMESLYAEAIGSLQLFTPRIEAAFQTMLVNLSDMMVSAGNDLISVLTETLNRIISAANRAAAAVRSAGGGASSSISATPLPISGYTLPRLATGTVVPPNREFLAVLGDNTTEPEVVSPLSTMKDAFLEAMQESGFAQNRGSAPTTINLQIDRTTLATFVLDLHEEESLRRGLSLVPTVR